MQIPVVPHCSLSEPAIICFCTSCVALASDGLKTANSFLSIGFASFHQRINLSRTDERTLVCYHVLHSSCVTTFLPNHHQEWFLHNIAHTLPSVFTTTPCPLYHNSPPSFHCGPLHHHHHNPPTPTPTTLQSLYCQQHSHGGFWFHGQSRFTLGRLVH